MGLPDGVDVDGPWSFLLVEEAHGPSLGRRRSSFEGRGAVPRGAGPATELLVRDVPSETDEARHCRQVLEVARIPRMSEHPGITIRHSLYLSGREQPLGWRGGPEGLAVLVIVAASALLTLIYWLAAAVVGFVWWSVASLRARHATPWPVHFRD